MSSAGHFLKQEIPLSRSLLSKSASELQKFTKVIQHMLAGHKQPFGLSESLAFRLLASVDWPNLDQHAFHQMFSPILNLRHLSLDSVLTKVHCGLLKLTENEVKSALQLWSDWRTKLVQSDSVDEPPGGEDDLIIMYAMAKWSSDDSSLKFGTYLHYGIPRAKLRGPPELYDSSTDTPDYFGEEPDEEFERPYSDLTLESLRICDVDDDDSGMHDSYGSPVESKTVYYRKRVAFSTKGKVSKMQGKSCKSKSEFLLNKSAVERRSLLSRSLGEASFMESDSGNFK